jgi:hypothetical protein
VLVASYSIHQDFLLGVAAVLSAMVLLAWYGLRLRYPYTLSALWGGRVGDDAVTSDFRLHARGVKIFLWQLWDLAVHGVPAAWVLYWYGPFLGPDGALHPGKVTSVAVAAALPMNIVWLVSLRFAIGRSLLFGSLADANVVYKVTPELPVSAWRWLFGSHLLGCCSWLAVLVLPSGVLQVCLFSFGICGGTGFIWMPYTLAWWMLFVSSLSSGVFLGAADARRTLLEGVCACSALTTSVGWYGTRWLYPQAFEACVRVWLIHPLQRFVPRLHLIVAPLAERTTFWWAVAFGDLFLHLFPTAIAILLFFPSVTYVSALIALPTNLVWWRFLRVDTLAQTNLVYGVSPEPPGWLWYFIYGNHFFVCVGIFFIAILRELLGTS